MKKLLAILMAICMVAVMVAACGGDDTDDSTATPGNDGQATSNANQGGNDNQSSSGGGKVGISMPTQSLQRWNQDGSNMKAAFEAEGFEVDLQYGGENDVATQISQIENMISGGCDVLVIAAIDGDSLGAVLGTAKDAGITVIAYDRLIMGTDAVSYYATFDNWKVGTMQGEYVRDTLGLDSNAGPFNIEFFTGDPGDNNINFFFDGAMSILQPYLDDGTLVCLSGQTEKAVVATPGWATSAAQERMENLISSNDYGPGSTELHAVMCSNDSTAQGATNALVNAGFDASNFPVITGQDCDIVSVRNMIAGTQSMSVFKDTRTLANAVVDIVKAIIAGNTPANIANCVFDTETYDNGTGVIPSFLCEPVFGDANNYVSLLIDSGYYTEAELAG